MKKEIDILELFSGIGGFSKGFIDAGYTIKNHSFSEIDKHAIANYKYNFKDAEHIGSVTDVRGIKTPDVLTFGSPCQDFSIAGKRMGMEGQRSSLIGEAIRLIAELRPAVFIWENVKGTFSSNNGQDFWAIIAAFANIGGYRLEWQLVNTSWFLPQNRERIYLIGHLAGRSKPGVFPFTENGGLFNKQKGTIQRRPQAENSTTIKQGFGNKADDTFISVPKIAGCLTGGGHSGGLHSDMTTIKVNSATKKGYEVAQEGDSINFSNPNSETRRGRVGKVVAQTLDTQGNQAVMIPHISRTDEAKAHRKASMANGKDHTPFQGKKIEWKISDVMNTITCATQKDNLVKSGTWRTHKDGNGFRELKSELAGTLPARAREDGSGQAVISIQNQIRRLTEIECEKLQGFPDNWTKYGDYNGAIKEIARTQRYKMCGNAVTVAVVKAIAERLAITDI